VEEAVDSGDVAVDSGEVAFDSGEVAFDSFEVDITWPVLSMLTFANSWGSRRTVATACVAGRKVKTARSARRAVIARNKTRQQKLKRKT